MGGQPGFPAVNRVGKRRYAETTLFLTRLAPDGASRRNGQYRPGICCYDGFQHYASVALQNGVLSWAFILHYGLVSRR
jgi:hypothetical protein